MNVEFIVPAAGAGTRLGASVPKALVPLAGEPLLLHTLRRLSQAEVGKCALIAAPPGTADIFERVLEQAAFLPRSRIFLGGSERQHSVANGLERLAPETEYVVIHDAARPFVPVSCILEALEAAKQYGVATLAIPCADTILMSDAENFLIQTPERKSLWACQTPQVFKREILDRAYAIARANQVVYTDDATLARSAGYTVKLVMGSPLNFKITTPADLVLAESLLAKGLV